MQQLTKAARSICVYMEQHSCGKTDNLVPNIIDSGVATWKGQPIVDAAGLVSRFGDTFKFGITLLLDKPMENEEVLKAVENVLANYAGKQIWLAVFGKALLPAQRQLISAYTRDYPIH